MPYYDTIDQDLERAKDILAKGRPKPEDFPYADTADRVAAVAAAGGHIFGVDMFAAYKLLESFVEEIERLRQGDPEPTLTCAGCDKPIPTKTVPMFCPTCSSDEERTRLRAALQTMMQLLGPDGVPADVDYGDKGNLAGLSYEVDEALRAVRSAGIEYKR